MNWSFFSILAFVPLEIQYDEKELFLQIAGGSEAAFRLIFELYRERLVTFAWQLCHSATDAEEVVQDVFLKIWKDRGNLVTIGFPRKYIYTMARNRTVDLLRAISRNEQMIKKVVGHLSQSENVTENLLYAKESVKLIQEAVAQLSEKKQAIFQLSRNEGLSHQEIAERTGLSIQTVKNTLTEILKHIRFFLTQHSEILAIVFWIQSYPHLF